MQHGSESAVMGTGARLDYAKRPMLVFWETTRACQLTCKHCRARATPGTIIHLEMGSVFKSENYRKALRQAEHHLKNFIA